MFGYRFAHQAHHRVMLARQLGYPLADKAAYGIWRWEKLWKECGLTPARDETCAPSVPAARKFTVVSAAAPLFLFPGGPDRLAHEERGICARARTELLRSPIVHLGKI
jgi:hypothetical protein